MYFILYLHINNSNRVLGTSVNADYIKIELQPRAEHTYCTRTYFTTSTTIALFFGFNLKCQKHHPEYQDEKKNKNPECIRNIQNDPCSPT